ncbi:hypothetical protein CRV24_008177 [Beauveria bassiana]|nr:hypothetical protein CRV24_008177 [Beauveria bassiana]KAH8716239.1 hypothetical protein HC256_005017 [Beauveria bassiana]
MEMSEHYAPFPGAHATPTKVDSNPNADVDNSSRLAAIPGPAYQDAVAQKALAASTPVAQPMHERPTLSAQSPVSVVLRTSPIKVDEYADYEVAITGKKRSRGRPKGSKAGMSYGQMRGGAGSRSVVHVGRSGRQKHIPNYSLKRRRRTVARPDPRTPRELYQALKPTFIGFLCEWSGCKANLHNMDTLRRHVDAIHLKPREQHCCLWGKCGEQSVARQIDGVALATHLEQAHLVPMTWHVGDGPKNSWNWSIKLEADAEAVADFLKDKEGNQVTPSTRDQLVEDLQTYRTNRRKLKELILRRDENLDSQSSDASEDEDMGSGL